MTVVDASLVVRLLQNRPGDAPLRDHLRAERHLHAPALIDAEVASAIRGLLISAQPGTRTSDKRADQMVTDFADLPLFRYPMAPMQHRVLELRHNFTAYDAFYVALAESLGMPLLTDDQKFARAPGHGVDVVTWG